jgi:hypothetical protein
MKRKNIILIMLLVLSGLFAMQSCVKEDSTTFTVHYAFTTPAATAPLDASTVTITGSTVDLKWSSTNKSGDAVKADVYFGTSATPALFKAGNTSETLTVTVAKGMTYYWKVVMTDANGITTDGPVWSFSVYDPINAFVGNYTVDEPAENWTYAVSFVRLSSTTIQIGNGAGKYDGWWASWTATFTLDLSANTYSMAKQDFSGGYTGVESGTIDPKTGTMTGTYTIWQTVKGVTTIAEQGTHTYTRN